MKIARKEKKKGPYEAEGQESGPTPRQTWPGGFALFFGFSV